MSNDSAEPTAESMYSKLSAHPLADRQQVTWVDGEGTACQARLTEHSASFFTQGCLPRLEGILKATDGMQPREPSSLATHDMWKPENTSRYNVSVSAYLTRRKQVFSRSAKVLEILETVSASPKDCIADEVAAGSGKSLKELQTMTQTAKDRKMAEFDKFYKPYTDSSSLYYSNKLAKVVPNLRSSLINRIPCKKQGTELTSNVDQFNALELALWENDASYRGFQWSLLPTPDASLDTDISVPSDDDTNDLAGLTNALAMEDAEMRDLDVQ